MLLSKFTAILERPNKTIRSLANRPDPNAFMNKHTKWFFTEFDKGFGSFYFAAAGMVVSSVAMYYLCATYVAPSVNEKIAKVPALRFPLADSHNIFWGLHTTTGLVRQVDLQEPAGPGEVFRPPVVVHSERSEQFPDYELVVMDVGEYDPQFKDDVHYRSVFYVSRAPQEKELKEIKDQKANRWAKATDVVEKTTNAPLNEPIHAMVKCRLITEEGNCQQFAGHLEDEISRKLLLTLGPYTIVRDSGYHMLKHGRITLAYDDPAKALVIGLRGGSLARFITSSTVQFKVDCVEGDASLIKIARRFLGHKESDAVHTIALNPLEYLQHLGSGRISKKYEVVMLDAIGPDGGLSRQYLKLDTLNNIKNAMTLNGVLGVVLPNSDLRAMKLAIDNFRLSFTKSSVILVHAETVPFSVLILARDEDEHFSAPLQDVKRPEFQQFLNTLSFATGNQNLRIDLTKEVSDRNYRMIPLGKTIDDLLTIAPPGHPAFEQSKRLDDHGIQSSLHGGKPVSWLTSVSEKLRFWSGKNVSPTLMADYGRDDK